ncbi:zinc finger protein ZFP2-like isoform X2 [Topomyia yanbarensis]|uniref:zinc finger protein ZFP2-like isoform X2 n=1 Tax=Topomyia yanbarensis TaxID=2498891 RepID=UPI00273A98A5|nr:zinc finger protein ZFP2-like isoform X2 [Topomyia yanbarensis]XP_058840346.1 zinc finger protein ZFP2-like isoform X2 [Topomyia yanbarensis]
MLRSCCIPVCKNAKLGADQSIGFHLFPTNTELRHKWVEFLGLDCKKFRWRQKYVCSEHFLLSELIENNGQKQLLDGAIPSIYSADECDEDLEYLDYDYLTDTDRPIERDNLVSENAARTHMEDVKLWTLFCRICLKKRSELLSLNSMLHNVALIDIIYTVTGLSLDVGVKLPMKICTSCVCKLDLAFNVRIEIMHFDLILKNMIETGQLDSYYETYDDHLFDVKSPNESYLSELIKKVEGYPAPMEHEKQLTLPELIEKVHAQEQSTAIVSMPSNEELECINEPMQEEHLENDQEEQATIDSKEQIIKESTEESVAFVQCDNSFDLKQEFTSDSEDERSSAPKRYVFSWKELYKPKIIPKKRRNIPELPKPELIPNTCYICNSSYEDGNALESHFEEHVSILPYTCEQCNTEAHPQVFRTLISLNRHLRSHLYPFLCEHCPLRFYTKASYTTHLEEKHETGRDGSTCNICGRYFAAKRPFLKHMADHRIIDSAKYKCENCGKIFRDGGLLRRHVRIHTGEQPFECKKCGRRFNHEANFQNHKRLHIGEKAYICSECGKNFVNATALRYHMADHFPNDPQYRVQNQRFNDGKLKNPKFYACPVEGCSFVSSVYVAYSDHRNKHMARHQCAICQKKFGSKSILARHTAIIHEGIVPEKNLPCPYCSKCFSNKRHLRLHIDVHENNRRFKCSFCEKTFIQKINCVVHERTHTGERPSVCRICPAKFITSSNRNKHEKLCHFRNESEEINVIGCVKHLCEGDGYIGEIDVET